MFETFQSGFRKCHSTETAVLKVLNDILMSCDFAILVLLDLTAAFDTVDHAVLIDWLEHCIGLRGVALDWFKSYFANRSFSVKMGEHYSSNACGVPQGSILAPLLFSLYMLPLVSIFRKHGLSFHFYADDTQVYLPVKLNSLGFESLMACLADVKAWLSLILFNFQRKEALSHLQLVQNAAARLLSGVKKREHITPILRSLHWLPVCFRVYFKILLLVYKSRNGLAPTYLCELLTEYQPIRSLRSSN